jgi:acetylornithine deacetylase/succinyl-diaminopimelate desuccinylase-like protein
MTLADVIAAFVDRDFARESEFLAELVKVPSDNPPGDCAAHAKRVRQLLESLGLAVGTHDVPRSAVEAAGMKSVTNLIVRHLFGDGPVVALNAHGDVVPPGLGWRLDPYGAVIEDGAHGPVMYGRGVAVSKSDFASYTWALLALKAAAAQGGKLGGTLELHFTYDEEAGGNVGPKWLLDQGLVRPDAVIAAGFSYSVVTAHNGCLHLEVTVTGKQAHAAMPEAGVDALEASNAILAALYAHRTTLARIRSGTAGIVAPTLNVGLIKGGINTNVVPDQVVFRIDRRVIPEENPAEVEAELRGLIAASARRNPQIKVEVRQLLLAAPLTPRPGADRIAGTIQRHAKQVLGVEVPVTGVPLYTDARHYAAAGIPIVLYGAGPPTRTCGSRTCAPRPRSSPWRPPICSECGEFVREDGDQTLNDALLGGRARKQRSLERARDCLFAFACLNGIADGNDHLPGLCEFSKAVGRCAASLVIEPIAKHRRGKKLGEGR